MRPPCTQPDWGKPYAIQDRSIETLSAFCLVGRETACSSRWRLNTRCTTCSTGAHRLLTAAQDGGQLATTRPDFH